MIIRSCITEWNYVHLVTSFPSLTFGMITSGNFVFLILRNWEDLRGLEVDSLYISNIFLKVRHAGSSLRCKSGILFERASTISPNQSSASIKRLDSNVMPFLAWTWLLSRLMAQSFFHLWNLKQLKIKQFAPDSQVSCSKGSTLNLTAKAG